MLVGALRGSLDAGVSAEEMTRIEKTCQIDAMKHPKQPKRASADPVCVAVPSYHASWLSMPIEKTLPSPDALSVFLKLGADPE